MENETNIGLAGFRIDPIERGQTFITDRVTETGKPEELIVMKIMGQKVQLFGIGAERFFNANLLGIARKAKIGSSNIIEVLPAPVGEE